jgi:hypothetical protein
VGGGSAHAISEPPTEFVTDLAGRLRHRVQLTTDGHRPYLEAVEAAVGMEIDYATLTKLYGVDPQAERRYSPPVCLGCEVRAITGSPERPHQHAPLCAAFKRL